jgi:hypothetical protein
MHRLRELPHPFPANLFHLRSGENLRKRRDLLTPIFSADASIKGEATGAMSYAFINSLKKNPNQSYVQLLNSIRDELEGKYSQKPQLSCSHPLSKSAPTPSNLFIVFFCTGCLTDANTAICRCRPLVRHVNSKDEYTLFDDAYTVYTGFASGLLP